MKKKEEKKKEQKGKQKQSKAKLIIIAFSGTRYLSSLKVSTVGILDELTLRRRGGR